MNLQDYMEKKTEIQTNLLDFLDREDNLDYAFTDFINVLKDQNFQDDKHEFTLFLRLILKISNNHHRTPFFFSKIEQILSHFSSNLGEIFTNFEIFKLFKNNKRILLFLFQSKIITIDQSIFDFMMKEKYQKAGYISYFFPEVESFLDESEKEKAKKDGLLNDFELFEKNRKNGENDEYIMKLIRNDSIDEFISHVNRTNFPLSATILPSIYETNSFLNKNQPSLIEYSTFFGSIQILKFLFLNKVDLTPSLWIYAIHGRNPEIIHFLEENQVIPKDKTYKECINESLKCHHHELTEYIHSNLYTNQNEKDFYTFSKSYKFYNFYFFPKELKNEFIFYDLCQYNYIKLVDFLVNTTNMDFNFKVIQYPLF